MSDSSSTRLPPARWRLVEDWLILFTEANAPITDDLWEQVLIVIDGERLRGVLSATGGDGFAKITKKQWRMAASIIRQRAYPVATVTEHAITLAMTRAASWLGSNTLGFKWRHLDDALEHLAMPHQLRQRASAALQELRDGIPPLAGTRDWPEGWARTGDD